MQQSARSGIFRGQKTLCIMPTFTCPAACSNCGTLSSPRERTNIELDIILDAIQQAKELDFANVVFTGGEATLRWNDLLQAIAYADSLGLPTRLVTNAHWAQSMERAEAKLETLIAHGLKEINYSTGDEHAKFVPLERVVYATVAAAKRGFRVHIMVELRKERRVTRDDIISHPLITALTPAEFATLTVTESPWMPLDPLLFEKYPPGIATNQANLITRKGCESVLTTYTLQADGRIGACCGLGLRLIPELNESCIRGEKFLSHAIKEAESDFLKLWIHYKGPDKILAWAAQKDPTIVWENMYAHPCQACQRIYKDPKVAKVIRTHYTEMMADVFQSAWLEEEALPEMLTEEPSDEALELQYER
uniref:Radical SAM core domain-containing protein n=1 Tax=Thermosporothrix sp. COM3 TaxID=2490863 RepID=A0A455SIX4_9CHLR|nr:hypothetical protein KTC_20690 [Thermosporothrix sp. COM3]